MLKVEGCPSGESPVTPRKRLHSAEDARCSSRPAPEGAGSVPITESEEKGGFCQQCRRKVAELKKQAQALADQSLLKVHFFCEGVTHLCGSCCLVRHTDKYKLQLWFPAVNIPHISRSNCVSQKVTVEEKVANGL